MRIHSDAAASECAFCNVAVAGYRPSRTSCSGIPYSARRSSHAGYPPFRHSLRITGPGRTTNRNPSSLPSRSTSRRSRRGLVRPVKSKSPSASSCQFQGTYRSSVLAPSARIPIIASRQRERGMRS
ncbi:MAG TPA: hypothetical protein VK665_14600 [Candidatus Elarobacter sp.]|nr:hypothetical protein [Candidatus Elarobacter sp.]